MSLQYKVRTEQEAEASQSNAVPEGRYTFKVKAVGTKPSKSGSPMLTVDFEVKLPSGAAKKHREWILLTDEWDFKLRHLADACGMLSSYTTGSLSAHDLIGRTGEFELSLRSDKDTGEITGNQVKAYIKRSTESIEVEGRPAHTPAKEEAPFRDDDINF